MSLPGDLELLGLDPLAGQDPTALAAAYGAALGADDQVAPADPSLPAPTNVPAVPPVPTPAPLAPGQSRGGSQSTSVSAEGVNPSMFDYFSTGKPAKGLEGQFQADQAQELGFARAKAENLKPGFDAARTATTEAGKAEQARAEMLAGDPAQAKAAVDRAGQTMGLQPVTTTGYAAQAEAEANIVANEQMEVQKALAETQKARLDYTQQVERLKTMRIDPHQMFGQDPLAMGLQNVTSALMVMSGKPGVAAAGQMLNDNLMKAVSRNVDAQLNNLQNQQKVADGFKAIYDMVVNENDTAATARHKMQGAYLAAVKGWIGSQAAQHDSKIIGAEIQKTLAGIDIQQAEAENAFVTEAQKNFIDRARIRSTVYATNVNASVAKAQIREARAAREAAAAEKAAERAEEQRVATAEGAVFATSPDGGMRYQGQLRGIPGSAEWMKAAREVQTIQSDAAVGMESLKRIHDLNEAIRNKDLPTLAAMGFSGIFDAKAAIKKQIGALSVTTGAKVASSLGLTPISDADLGKVQEGIGSENFVGSLVAHMGLDTSSAKATGEVMSLIQRNVDNQLKAYLRPAEPGELAAIESRYGSQAFYEQQPQQFNTITPGLFDTPGVPAPGVAAMGDITKFQPNAMPGRKAEVEGILHPKPSTEAETLTKKVAEYKPGDEVYKTKDEDEVPNFYRAFAADMQKSGFLTDQGRPFSSLASAETDMDKLAILADDPFAAGTGGDKIQVPNFADDVAELANKAFYEGNADAAAVLQDLAGRTDDIGKLAGWALKNPEQFDRTGAGYLVP